jgi:hypothetical protein
MYCCRRRAVLMNQFVVLARSKCPEVVPGRSMINPLHLRVFPGTCYTYPSNIMTTTALQLAARSLSSAATITTQSKSEASPTESTLDDYNYQTSSIVRIAIVSGVIVLIITGIVLFFKVSLLSTIRYRADKQVTSWIRYYRRQRRQIAIQRQLQNEQRENAYELAAWEAEPGTLPAHGGGLKTGESEKKKNKKLSRRGAANAYAVSEWEGVAQ